MNLYVSQYWIPFFTGFSVFGELPFTFQHKIATQVDNAYLVFPRSIACCPYYIIRFIWLSNNSVFFLLATSKSLYLMQKEGQWAAWGMLPAFRPLWPVVFWYYQWNWFWKPYLVDLSFVRVLLYLESKMITLMSYIITDFLSFLLLQQAIKINNMWYFNKIWN